MSAAETESVATVDPKHRRARSKRRFLDWPFFQWLIPLAVSVTGVVLAYLSLSHQLGDVGRKVERVDARVNQAVVASQFLVTTPRDNTEVSVTEIVRGATPYGNVPLYVVVTPLNDGGDWIQPGKVTIAGGIWIGRAQFGSRDLGLGDLFIVRALVTRQKVEAGPLVAVPPDAVFSTPITVKRTR